MVPIGAANPAKLCEGKLQLGLDIPQITRVISANVPRNNTRAALFSRILRIGRTQSGEAFLIVNNLAGDGEYVHIIKQIFLRHTATPDWMNVVQKKADILIDSPPSCSMRLSNSSSTVKRSR